MGTLMKGAALFPPKPEGMGFHSAISMKSIAMQKDNALTNANGESLILANVVPNTKST